MDFKQQEILNSSKLFISKNIQYNDLLKKELSILFTQPEMDELESQANQYSKGTFLIDRLRSKGNAAYNNFLRALARSENAKNYECASYIRRQETNLMLQNMKSSVKTEIYPIMNQRKGVFIINSLKYDLTQLTDYFTRKDFDVTVLTQEECTNDLLDKIVNFFDTKAPYYLLGLVCICEGTEQKGNVKEKLVLRREPPREELVLLREQVLFRFHLEKYKGLPKFAVFVTRLCEYDKEIPKLEEIYNSHEGSTNLVTVDFDYTPQTRLLDSPAANADGQFFIKKWIDILHDDPNMDLQESICLVNIALRESQITPEAAHARYLAHCTKRMVFVDAKGPKKA